MNDDDRLTSLLAAPLAPVADNGFTDRVMARAAPHDYPLTWIELAVLAACAIFVVPFVPLQPVMDAAVNVSVTLANSQFVATAALATTASLWFLRYAAE